MRNLLLIIIFLILYVTGHLFNLYNNITYFDLIIQVILGIIACIIAINTFKKANITTNKFVKITYILGMIFLFSGVLELAEYTVDRLFQTNIQDYKFVDDTMIDIITSFLSGLVILLFYKEGEK